MDIIKCELIFKKFQAMNPNPITELNYNTTFELLVAVMLSAQTTDKNVNKVTTKLFPIANTPQQILALGEARLKDYIKTLGLFNTKARNLMQTCRILLDQYHQTVPAERTALQALPGVGRKTANVILNTAFGHAVIAVDTHVFRVANRTGIAPGTTPNSVEQKLLQNIPKKFHTHAHHWLVLHGRFVCVARNPKCSQCVIVDFCEYSNKTK
jgi:endonuclease-3